ncbi:GST C domain containing protein [Asbolus verrucosus]|uniref:glutathione transferase n=1 Tax=Asbolus verrucosus TaxID=1661398 RepID=A0A482VQ51_ASBVE|nr:GST C domain containing protein [Asbolus verrucosus]
MEGSNLKTSEFEFENWPQFKPNMPFGQVPILEHNGKVVNQSVAIARYLGKQVKLVGNDDCENLEIDAIVDTINDLRQKIALYSFEKNEAIKESRKEPLFKETLAYYLKRLDNIVEANNGHLALGKLTWADLYFGALVEYFIYMCGSDYSNLVALKIRVFEIPAIKVWLEKRPKFEY